MLRRLVGRLSEAVKKKSAFWRDVLDDALIFPGVCAIVYGTSLWSVAAAWIVGGCFGILFGLARGGPAK